MDEWRGEERENLGTPLKKKRKKISNFNPSPDPHQTPLHFPILLSRKPSHSIGEKKRNQIGKKSH